MFQYSDEKLTEMGAVITTREIEQQPKLWQETFDNYVEKLDEITGFISSISEHHSYVRVIFTGAGTSQYVGDIAARSLLKLGDTSRFRFESIATTDIVSSPQTTLEAKTPTILVSFGRSGNSPESVAAVEMVEQVVEDSYHIFMTCAKEGKLALAAPAMDNALLLLLPDKSNDLGFAMTGSCSCMTLLATLVFSTETVEAKGAQVATLAKIATDIIEREEEVVAHFPTDIERVIYVGSGAMAAVTRETQLKILELTAGKIATLYDSSMGLRHGPKSFIDEKTAIYVFASNDVYTRQYDMDIFTECRDDAIAKKVVLIGQNVATNDGFNMLSETELADEYLVLASLVFGQIISLNASVIVGNTPDTPSATGTVNRVVKGVTIHPYEV
jgi:tagatose-6-phosphate ketose/aldose isomerase